MAAAGRARVAALVLAAAFLAIAAGAGPLRADPPAAAPVDVELFVRTGCPHCARAKAFLDDLRRERPGLTVVVRDVVDDPGAAARLERLAEEGGVLAVATPAFAVRAKDGARTVLVVGFADRESTGARVVAILDGREPAEGEEGPGCPANPAEEPACEPGEGERDEVIVPFLGRVRAGDVGLPAFTIVVGLLDGFNPCAMWVLVFLLSLLVNFHSRAKMLLVAGTFVLVSGLVYFAFMAAWLNFFLIVGLSRGIQVALGALAALAGAIHVKDFFAFHRGVTLSIPESAKPGIYARVNRILRAEHAGGALVGVVALALMVNMVELLCTAGLPAVYTHVLTAHRLPAWQYYGYLALYQVFYMIDDAILLAIGVITLSRRRLQERSGRWLKLVSGVVMLVLAAMLLAKPEWLYF